MDTTLTTQATEDARLGDRVVALLKARVSAGAGGAHEAVELSHLEVRRGDAGRRLRRELGVNLSQIDGALRNLHRDEKVQGFNVNLVPLPGAMYCIAPRD